METKNITKYVAPTHVEFAESLAYRLGKNGISSRVGMRVKTVMMTETISEKARRVLASCDSIMCK